MQWLKRLQKQLNQMEQVIKATGQDASELMQMSTDLKSNVEFILGATVTALEGENELTGITLSQNGETRRLAVEGLFVAIGHKPDTEAFREVLQLDEAGYATAGEDCCTGTPGLFVAGDCRRKTVRQLTTACADGAVAALAACGYIDRLGK